MAFLQVKSEECVFSCHPSLWTKFRSKQKNKTLSGTIFADEQRTDRSRKE
jgi:hypothetical protein